jgi:hypothetical protein
MSFDKGFFIYSFKLQLNNLMKKLHSLPLIISFALITFTTVASTPGEKEKKMPKNYLKFNITSPLLSNYSFQYERVLTRGMTFGLGFRFMPETGIPHYDMIKDQIEADAVEDLSWLEDLTLQNYAITPELRFYTGKRKYGRGFYFSLFYRYANYEAGNLEVPFTPDMGDEITLYSSGTLISQTGGFMLGAQWALGKHICLDWWILGPHIGLSSGRLIAEASSPFSSIDQQDIRQAIEEIEVPMLSKDFEVTADKIDLKFDGPSAGIRAGISLGFRF